MKKDRDESYWLITVDRRDGRAVTRGPFDADTAWQGHQETIKNRNIFAMVVAKRP